MRTLPRRTRLALIVIGILLILSAFIFSLTGWLSATFGVSIREILYTLTSPLDGADSHFLAGAVKYIVPWVLLAIVLFIVAVIIRAKIEKYKPKIKKVYMTVLMIIAIASMSASLIWCNYQLSIPGFILASLQPTHIYEDYYVDPDTVEISSNGDTKNVIYIYLESMENTYASKDVGGFQTDYNYIPHLTQMAFENTSFSDNEQLGGFYSGTGMGWTIAALFATTSGVPFSFPVKNNSMDKRENFAAGITTLGDILEEKGYYQEFLCGSDSEFAGRDLFFSQHGGYEIFDYNTAIEQKYIVDSYKVWWGIEDAKLYNIAKDELLRISQLDQPFNFTMLTVDTHHIDGYVCRQCEDTYDTQLANVVACADKQVYEFINWCKEQYFYENTVIIITGDHPRMDTSLVDGAPVRTVYNCFINAEGSDTARTINRTYTAVDLFPTILSSMGFTIEGDRLGLGTNMFSDLETLPELMGLEKFNSELDKYSKFYIDNFS